MNALVEATQAGALMSFIERAARDPEFDVNKFEALLRMQREVIQEQERRLFNEAMAKAQTAMAPIVRDAENTHTHSKYAKLETIDREMRPIYTRHGFAVRFGSAPSPRDGWMRIICTVSHTGGYAETNYLDAPPDDTGSRGTANKTGVQAVGSAVSYLRRYLLVMVFNIVLADEDNDGQQTRRMTLREWLDDFEARCKAARNEADANAILKEEAVIRLDDPDLKINDSARNRALAVRKAMVARIWATPEDDAEQEVASSRGSA